MAGGATAFAKDLLQATFTPMCVQQKPNILWCCFCWSGGLTQEAAGNTARAEADPSRLFLWRKGFCSTASQAPARGLHTTQVVQQLVLPSRPL